MSKTTDYDVIIIGGSYAGLQAALTLGRSLRNVLVVDGGLPCNRYTPHSQNFLTYDGTKPSEISQLGRKQIESTYGRTVKFLDDDIVIKGSSSSSNGNDGKEEEDKNDLKDTTTPTTTTPTILTIETKSGKIFTCKKLIVASGVIDQIPTHIPGFEDCWGKSIIHCPYCHGYEYHSKRTGLYLTKAQHVNMAFSHLLPLLHNLTNKIYVVLDSSSGCSGNDDGDDNNEKLVLSDEQVAKATKHGITVIHGALKSIQHDSKGYMSSVTVGGEGNSQIIELDAMYAMLPTKQSCTVPHDMFGCDVDETNGLLKVNPMSYKTNVEGIFAVGDTMTPFRTVANAVASGNMAGAIANMELSQAEF